MPATPAAGPPSLRLLGGAVVLSGETLLDGPVAQRHRIALLAILAIEARPVSRDKLVAYLWPERDTEAARNLLKTAVHAIRKQLGEDVIVSSGDLLSLDQSLLRCDVADFESAVKRGDLRAALDLYAGPFLDGFFLKGSAEFEDWASAERARLERIHEKVKEALGDSAEIPSPAGVYPERSEGHGVHPAPSVLSPHSALRPAPRLHWYLGALLVIAVISGVVLFRRPTAADPPPPAIVQPNDVDPGTALEFDGRASQASTPAGTVVTTQTDDIAVDMWLRYAGPSANAVQTLFYNGHGSLTGWGLLVVGKHDGQRDGTVAVMAGGITIRATPLVLKQDVWQHLAAERRGGKITLTLDDSSYGLGDFPVTPMGGKFKETEHTSLGTDAAPGVAGQSFNGRIDRLRMRNLAAGYWYDRWYFDEGKGATTSGYKSNVLQLRNVKWVPSAPIAPRDIFWSRLESFCDQAYSGKLTASSATDSAFARGPLILFAYRCAPTEIRLALPVGADRSRVIVLRRVPGALSLEQLLSRADGTTGPGSGSSGVTREAGLPGEQTFVGEKGDEWRLEVEPAKQFIYVARPGKSDSLRIEFPIDRQVASPPPPWGR